MFFINSFDNFLINFFLYKLKKTILFHCKIEFYGSFLNQCTLNVKKNEKNKMQNFRIILAIYRLQP